MKKQINNILLKMQNGEKSIDETANELNLLLCIRNRISRVDLEDYADQYIKDRYRKLDYIIWNNEMEVDRKVFMEGMKRIYYAV